MFFSISVLELRLLANSSSDKSSLFSIFFVVIKWYLTGVISDLDFLPWLCGVSYCLVYVGLRNLVRIYSECSRSRIVLLARCIFRCWCCMVFSQPWPSPADCAWPISGGRFWAGIQIFFWLGFSGGGVCFGLLLGKSPVWSTWASPSVC